MIVDFTGEDRDYVAPICLGTNHDDVKIRGWLRMSLTDMQKNQSRPGVIEMGHILTSHGLC
jgi:hypothetical protein